MSLDTQTETLHRVLDVTASFPNKTFMTIVQVNLQRDYGGAEAHVLALAQGLHNRGHQVCVFAHPQGKLLGKARELGLDVVPLAARGQIDFKSTRQFARALRQVRPDVLHLHTPKDYVSGVVAAKLVRVPVVAMTRHMLLPVKPWMRRIYNATDAVVCLSQGVRDNLCEQEIRSAKLHLILGAIDTNDLAERFGAESVCAAKSRELLRREFGLEPDSVAIGVVGRLVTGKGHTFLLRAFAQLNAPTAKLIVVGEGALFGSLQEETMRLGLQERVVFAGFRTDVPAILQALDIVVLPSDGTEVFPLVVMEAMAAARAVVASRIGGVGEIVEDERTGLLVPPRDVEALATALSRLVFSAALREKLGVAGKLRVQQHFSLTRFLDETEQLYRRSHS